MHYLIDQAIKFALIGDWEQAIKTNQTILEMDPKDIATLNRLARAYGGLGDKEKAEKTYEEVLRLDKYNSIASKNIRLLPHQKFQSNEIIKEDFIETPGLTKTISLVKVTSRENLGTLTTRQKIDLCVKGRLIAATTNGVNIGCLPDDLSFKIKKLLAKGYEYTCCIKSISDNAATIFIREHKRPNRSGYTATFSKTLTYSKLKK